MTVHAYTIRQCQNPACALRYPLVDEHPFGERCPLCLGETIGILQAPLAPESPPPHYAPQRMPLSIILDNIRSAWNVGAIFRTADGLGIRHLYLCGITPTPENKSVQKTSLGAEHTVPWSRHPNALTLSQDLATQGITLWALEQTSTATPMNTAPALPTQGAALVLGNEITGVDPDILNLCQHTFYIPMRGRKRSLNVEVAFAIAAHTLIEIGMTGN